jgi:hypothetical protein
MCAALVTTLDPEKLRFLRYRFVLRSALPSALSTACDRTIFAGSQRDKVYVETVVMDERPVEYEETEGLERAKSAHAPAIGLEENSGLDFFLAARNLRVISAIGLVPMKRL